MAHAERTALHPVWVSSSHSAAVKTSAQQVLRLAFQQIRLLSLHLAKTTCSTSASAQAA